MAYFICEKQGRCCQHEFYNSIEQAIADSEDGVPCDHLIEVTPVRHGRWIEYTKVIIPEPYNKWEQAWKCSECGFDDGFVAYNYCPNCGARCDK